MKDPDNKIVTLRDRLYATVGADRRADIDRLITDSVRGSDRIEGIQRAPESYSVESASQLRRTPRQNR